MNATRIKYGDTENIKSLLLGHIEDSGTDVRLFATHSDENGKGYNELSGPIVNLPLVAALIYDGYRWIVYDGNLLNARRGPRIAEVQAVIDAAIKHGKVLYGAYAVDFTAIMSSEDAARYLKEVPTDYLTKATQKKFEGLLHML